MSLLRHSPTEAAVSLFCILAHCTNIFTVPESCLRRPPRLRAMAAVLTPPKQDLQRDSKACALHPLNEELSSVETHCEPRRRWCLASIYMLGAFSSQFS